MDKDGEASEEEEVIAEQNDEALVEATKEEHWQANPRYKTTTNTPTKRPARSVRGTEYTTRAATLKGGFSLVCAQAKLKFQ